MSQDPNFINKINIKDHFPDEFYKEHNAQELTRKATIFEVNQMFDENQ